MRLAGRIAAAAEVLADVETRRRPVADSLKDWGLAHRFAGSGDRAAIGNLVYDALRRRLTIAWRMEADTPWALATGAALLSLGLDAAALNAEFAADPHAPEPIPEPLAARLASLGGPPDAVRAELPDWVAARFQADLGADWADEGAAFARRPPLDLRVNTLRAERDKMAARLGGLGAEPTPFSPVGLRIPPAEGARRHPNIQAEEAFRRGRIEVQDEGSQLCALLVGARPGDQVLDLCAGAGGKTLALAAATGGRGQVFATDSDRTRLAPIWERLKRAEVRNVQVRTPRGADVALDDLVGRMDRVLVDAPCTGSGVWRRRPDAKWRLTPEALARRTAEQDAALAAAAPFVRPGGVLAYVTCSLFAEENGGRIAAFRAAHPDFAPLAPDAAWAGGLAAALPAQVVKSEGAFLLTPHRCGTDGFFLALLRRAG